MSNFIINPFQFAAAFAVTHSADFAGGAGDYFNQTFGAPTDADKWTFWTHFKQDSVAVNRSLIGANGGTAGTSDYFFALSADNQWNMSFADGTETSKISTALSDTASWHYMCIVYDLSAGGDNVVRIYLDSTSPETDTGTEPSATVDAMNISGKAYAFGARNRGGTINMNFDGHTAYSGFLDGTADTTQPGYDAGSPAEYTGGAFGNNGWLLEYKQTGANLGVDTSGNGNDFTVNGTVTRTTDIPS